MFSTVAGIFSLLLNLTEGTEQKASDLDKKKKRKAEVSFRSKFDRPRYLAMDVTATGQFLLVLMVCSARAIICSTYGNETDRLSLLEFKKAISLDPQQALMSWNDSTNFCNWEGVQCSVKTPRRVTSLDLGNRGLVGHISPSLGNLTFLKHLILPTNAFTGEIPASLGYLHRLQTLYLSNNTLQGRTPSLENCSNLEALWLDRNQLVGQIPVELPRGLQELKLSYNNLTGAIPASLANITMLNVLTAGVNNIKGNIPKEFAKLSRLQRLQVGANQLSGRFQQAIINISTLSWLVFAYNNLSGELPSNLGNALPNLQILALSSNFFHGHIPGSLINASKLYLFDLSSNNFTGVVPSSIGKLTKLSILDLELNQLRAHNKQDWEFMHGLANCTELQYFAIDGNHLEGHVPNSLGNLSVRLQVLNLRGNQLSGGFPFGIANFPNLINLGLDDNRFIGVVPEWLGTLKKLQGISLDNNIFTGFIPTSLSNLSQLGYLYLGSNRFDGHIQPSLGNLQMLEVLDISNNNLHGTIPKEIFRIPTIRIIEFSFNNLEGQLSTEIGNAKQLTYLQLSSNKLSGDIPNTLGNCESLEDIELDWNIFSGNIPASLGNIRNLKVINFSHNNLTGSIPASLGTLQLLEKLDLSFNHLEGEVPTKGIFKNATAIQIDGNQWLCGGAKVLHLPACSITPSNSSKHKLCAILKVVIPVASMVSLAMVISFLWRGKQKRKYISSPLSDSKFPKVSYNDLARATDGFSTSNLISRGRYSSVYQGKLFQDGNVVAVKVFSLETRGAQKSFIAECNTLRNVRHRNLVPILTVCSSIDSRGNDFKALVYEFMPRGDLHKLLYSTEGDENSSKLNYISLTQRLNIVVDVSDALAYLHHSHQGTIVHCDLKPSNILLDDNMTAHIGDFGLARFKIDSTASSFDDSNLASSIAVKGTIGYVAPECAGGGEVSTASDVYSFGIVLLEIFIRTRPTDDMFKDGLSIAKFAEINFPDKMLQIVDPQLLQELDLSKEAPMAIEDDGVHCLLSMLNIELCCTKPSPKERISMQEVTAKLHGIRDAYLRDQEEIEAVLVSVWAEKFAKQLSCITYVSMCVCLVHVNHYYFQ